MMSAKYQGSYAISISSSKPSWYHSRIIVTVHYLILVCIQLDSIIAIEVSVDVSLQA